MAWGGGNCKRGEALEERRGSGTVEEEGRESANERGRFELGGGAEEADVVSRGGKVGKLSKAKEGVAEEVVWLVGGSKCEG